MKAAVVKGELRLKSRVLLLSGLVLAGTGAWISGELVKRQADLWGPEHVQTGLFARLCAAAGSAGFGCNEAAKSPWGLIKVPIPVPSAGLSFGTHTVIVPVSFVSLAYFVFMGVWLAFIGGPRRLGRSWHRVPRFVGLGGAVASFFYLGIMVSGRAPACVGCLVLHAVNLCMVVVVWRLYPVRDAQGRRDAPADMRPERSVHATLTSREVSNAVAFSLILIVGLWFYRRERIAIQSRIDNLLVDRALVTSLRADPEFLVREYYAQSEHPIPPRPGEPRDDGRATLVMFTDFECPPCYCKAAAVHQDIRNAFDGRLAIRIRHYPLSNACNDNVDTDFHRNACDAAHAAEAARRLGGETAFWRMYALLYENRKQLSGEIYGDLAVRIGLDENRFRREMDSEPVRRIVRSDITLASALGVRGTPAVFLDGRRVTSLCQTPAFWDAIARAPAPRQECEAVASAGVDGAGPGNDRGLE